jgi:anti-repressor protein
MSETTKFDYEGARVRIVVIDGAPWFHAGDVTYPLRLPNAPKALRSLPADDKGRTQMVTPGGRQEVLIVSRSGLYKLAFRSDTPEAREFLEWVVRVVLPAIRTATGGTSGGR